MRLVALQSHRTYICLMSGVHRVGQVPLQLEVLRDVAETQIFANGRCVRAAHIT